MCIRRPECAGNGKGALVCSQGGKSSIRGTHLEFKADTDGERVGWGVKSMPPSISSSSHSLSSTQGYTDADQEELSQTTVLTTVVKTKALHTKAHA